MMNSIEICAACLGTVVSGAPLFFKRRVVLLYENACSSVPYWRTR